MTRRGWMGFLMLAFLTLQLPVSAFGAPTTEIQVFIKTLDGQKKPFTFDSGDTVTKVKDVLAEKTGIYKDMIRLVFQGAPMPDEKTLEALKVTNGSVIHMIMQLRGG